MRVAFVVARELGHDRVLREGLGLGVDLRDDVLPARQRPKRGGSESQVLRPMITGAPAVCCLKCAMSSGRCQGMVLSLPITPLAARAKMRLMRAS
jgi:hypothetical protein